MAYDGSRFHGWQKQENAETIQGTIENCLQKMAGTRITLYGAGRTDAGVHALGMVANFKTTTRIPCSGFLKGLNSMLPRDIRILEAVEAEGDFHSRYSAVGKSYRYDIYTGEIQLPTERLYYAHFPGTLDNIRIDTCLKKVIGRHDFTSFEGSGSRDTALAGGRGAFRTLYQASFFPHTEKPDHWSFRFIGDGFLRHMVRNLAGTLIDVGRKKLDTDDFRRILVARDRSVAAPTAPAHSLFLERVYYDRTMSEFMQ